ncbi:hypothetical protein BHM03_00028699 [Ensete ventricosum]|nr:hypothetical protein BHM03_00028699 [Ensete ventricosum]
MTREGCASGTPRISAVRDSSLPWVRPRSEAAVGLGQGLAKKFSSNSFASKSNDEIEDGLSQIYHIRVEPLKSTGALATSDPPSIAKNVVRFDVVVEESARLGSARVRKLLRISREEVEKFERGQLDLLGSASRAPHSRDLPRDLAQRPCQGFHDSCCRGRPINVFVYLYLLGVFLGSDRCSVRHLILPHLHITGGPCFHRSKRSLVCDGNRAKLLNAPDLPCQMSSKETTSEYRSQVGNLLGGDRAAAFIHIGNKKLGDETRALILRTERKSSKRYSPRSVTPMLRYLSETRIQGTRPEHFSCGPRDES